MPGAPARKPGRRRRAPPGYCPGLVDVLEGGAGRRRPGGRVLAGIAAAAVLAAVVVNQYREHRPRPAAAPPAPAPSPTVRPGLVYLGSRYDESTRSGTRTFRLAFELHNANRLAVRVEAVALPAQPAFDRLQVALLDVGALDGGALPHDGATAAPGPLSVPALGSAALVIRGHATCARGAARPAGAVGVLVDGHRVDLDVPDVEDVPWTAAVTRSLCPRPAPLAHRRAGGAR
jgi:hypothetical protein